ncbi:unnamed protein product [Symbiodinium sp. CCMP2592]|nr:unnamed protein product [Symbiodinium sp. CCMP2592]
MQRIIAPRAGLASSRAQKNWAHEGVFSTMPGSREASAARLLRSRPWRIHRSLPSAPLGRPWLP